MKYLLMILLVISCNAKDLEVKLNMFTFQFYLYNYTLSIPGTEDTIYNTNKYSLNHIGRYTYGKFQLTTQIIATREHKDYINSKFQDKSYLYLNALYLEYYINDNLSLYAGIIPYQRDPLNVYDDMNVNIGEGIYLISGNLKPSIGLTYSKYNFLIKIGRISSKVKIPLGPYSNSYLDKLDYEAYSLRLCYHYNSNHITQGLYKANITDNNINKKLKLINTAVEYKYSDKAFSGLEYVTQVALSEVKSKSSYRGYALYAAVLNDSDVLPNLYKFNYGFEYIHTSKDFISGKTSYANNRNSNLYKGDSYTIYSKMYLSKRWGVSVAYNISKINYLRQSFYKESIPINLTSKSYMISLFYHF